MSDKTSDKRLLNCPFCGGNKVGLWHNKSISPLILGTHNVQCYDCHFGLAPSKTKEEAIEKWNTRKPMQEIEMRLREKLLHSINNANDEMFENGHTLDFEHYFGEEEAYQDALLLVKEVGGMNDNS